MNLKIIIQRLAFAKYLIQKGNLESESSDPLSSTCILNYHDALEFAFDLVLTDKGISNNNLSFMQYFDKINEWLKENSKTEISLRPSLEKIKDRRVNLKHKGLFPSKTDIEESKVIVNQLFEELCKNVYELNIKDISLIELIDNKRVKSFILEAVEKYPSNQKKVIEKLSLSFEFLLRDYEQSKTDLYRNSPFYFGKDMTFLSAFLMGLNPTDKIGEFVDKVKESIEAMQKAVKILAFGFDYKKYIKFRLLIPEPMWFIGGYMPKVHLSEDANISEKDFDFCTSYLVECALKLQEFDFEIKKEMICKMKLKQYPKYKDSGVQWIGKIPEEWELQRGKYQFKVTGGYAFPSNDFVEEGVSLIRIGDISEGTINLEDCKKLPKGYALTKKDFLLNEKEVLVAMTGATIGKVGQVPKTDKKMLLNQRVGRIKTKYSSDFYKYVLTADFIKEQIRLIAEGAAQENISGEQIEGFVIPQLDKTNQTQIANFLDRKTQNISQTIEKDKKLIELLKEKRIALINHVVTKGTRNIKNISGQFEQGSNRLDKNAKMKESGIDWIGKIPEGWDVKKLKKCCNIKAQYGAGCEPEDNEKKQDYRYVRITDITELGRLRKDSFAYLSKENGCSYILKENDVLFARSGATVGKTYYYLLEDGKCVYAGYLIRYKTNKILNSRFLFFYTLSKSYLGWIKRTLVQSTIENVSAEKYNEMIIPIPPKPEQLQIVKYLDTQTQKIDQTISKIQEKITLMEEYKKSLIHHVVTGKVDVRTEA